MDRDLGKIAESKRPIGAMRIRLPRRQLAPERLRRLGFGQCLLEPAEITQVVGQVRERAGPIGAVRIRLSRCQPPRINAKGLPPSIAHTCGRPCSSATSM